jgi:hypothetical protein
VDVVAHAFGVSSPKSAADQFIYDAFPVLVEFRMPDPSGNPPVLALNGNAPPGGAVVQVGSSNPSVVQLPPTVTIPAGSSNVAVPLTILPTPTEQQVTLSASYRGSTLSGTLVVMGSPPLAITAPDTLALNESGDVQITLNKPAPASGALVKMSSSNPGAIAVPTQVTIASGKFSASLTITNKYSGNPERVEISASYNGLSASDGVLVPTPANPCQGCGSPAKCCVCWGGTWSGNQCQ